MSDAPALVRLERREDGVAVITLDNPKVNALSRVLVAKLTETAHALLADLPKAVVVTGGERIFAAGADITDFEGLEPDEAMKLGEAIQGAMDAVAAIPRMVIAAVAGYALGGGCELALACDVRIASERAVFGQPEILLGILPGAGGTQRLPRLIGPSKAKELILSGRQVAADEALRIGLADEVVPHESLHDRVFELAAQYAAGPLTVQGLAKRAIDEGLSTSLAKGLLVERESFAKAFGTEDAAIGVRSFLDQGPGKAQFTGR
jgi:enoyl-CoA hydratase